MEKRQVGPKHCLGGLKERWVKTTEKKKKNIGPVEDTDLFIVSGRLLRGGGGGLSGFTYLSVHQSNPLSVHHTDLTISRQCWSM